MRIKKDIQPFGKNIKHFIFANEMTRQDFADRLNSLLQQREIDAKIYSSNDIWTYDSRGSFPKDPNILTAVSEIICKPLNELLTIEYSMEELKLDLHKEVQIGNINIHRSEWSIDQLNKLTEAESDFILDLISTGVYEEEGKWISYFDIALRYNKGKTVTATLYYGSDYSKEREVEWSWKRYGEYIEEIDDEASIIDIKLDLEIYNKLYEIGLVKDAYCLSCDFDELPDDRYKKLDGYFVAKVVFNINRTEIINILELIVGRAKKYYELLEHERMIELEDTSK